FYQPLTPPTGLGLLGVAPRWAFSRSGSAWLGRSQKDGLPSCCGDMRIPVQGHQLAHRGEAAWSLTLSNPNQHGRALGRYARSASSGKAADVLEAPHLTRIAHNLDRPFR